MKEPHVKPCSVIVEEIEKENELNRAAHKDIETLCPSYQQLDDQCAAQAKALKKAMDENEQLHRELKPLCAVLGVEFCGSAKARAAFLVDENERLRAIVRDAIKMMGCTQVREFGLPDAECCKWTRKAQKVLGGE